jgi:hypothetical protein
VLQVLVRKTMPASLWSLSPFWSIWLSSIKVTHMFGNFIQGWYIPTLSYYSKITEFVDRKGSHYIAKAVHQPSGLGWNSCSSAIEHKALSSRKYEKTYACVWKNSNSSFLAHKLCLQQRTNMTYMMKIENLEAWQLLFIVDCIFIRKKWVTNRL